MEKYSKNISTLKQLSTGCYKKRHKIIKNNDHSLIHCICECVHNVLNGKVSIKEKELKKLTKYKTVLRKLNKPDTIKHKKKLIIQSGGFLQYLIPLVIPLITSLIEK